MKAQGGSKSTALLILNLCARLGWVGNAMPWLLYPQEKALVSMVLESGWTLWLVCTGAKKEKSLVPTGI